MQGNLFEKKYPKSPGHAKRSETSYAAAKQAQFFMNELHRDILHLLKVENRPMHFYEIAHRLGVSDRNIQPRCTELKLNGYIHIAAQILKEPGSKTKLSGYMVTQSCQ